MESIISFKDARITGGDNIVIHSLNMEVGKGDLVYISGRVGSGKTSIIRTITAETPLAGGEGLVCGYDLNTIREKDIPFLRRKIGVVFQDFQLLMDRSVSDNLEFVLKATGWKDGIRRRIDDVLDAVDMNHKAHRMPHQLSGGEQQRIAIARALLNSPEVILADEPTGNLDSETADGILKLLNTLNKERSTAVVMVTHNRDIFVKYPGTIYECRNETCECLTRPCTTVQGDTAYI